MTANTETRPDPVTLADLRNVLQQLTGCLHHAQALIDQMSATDAAIENVPGGRTVLSAVGDQATNLLETAGQMLDLQWET